MSRSRQGKGTAKVTKGYTMVVYLSLLVAVIGLLAYALSANSKVAEIGRISFFCGLFAFLLQLGTAVAVLHR